MNKHELHQDDENYRRVLGAAIRSRRKAIGVSVAEVAQFVGVSVQAVYYWERGLRAPEWDRIPALASILKTTPKKLVPDT